MDQRQAAPPHGRPLRLPYRPSHRGICEARPPAAADISYQNQEKITVGFQNIFFYLIKISLEFSRTGQLQI